MTVKPAAPRTLSAKGLVAISALAFAVASGSALAADADRDRGSYSSYSDSAEELRGSYGPIRAVSATTAAAAENEADVSRVELEPTQPQIKVEQADPEISVEQAEPQVEIDHADDAEVRVIRDGEQEDRRSVEIQREARAGDPQASKGE